MTPEQKKDALQILEKALEKNQNIIDASNDSLDEALKLREIYKQLKSDIQDIESE